ncbi:HEAT repeat-containing protein 6 isoform X1 [Aricia agestis]|uniref:HEAT repeat-containing protein 6 isoform X1 n=1 Tax=Aricia agestis TaxID=91739 RepID=UPI001C207619|nr:HEAT repeat-containing protein 6 isoform X1 [Aricia agestis]
MNLSQQFSMISTELCNNLYVKGYNKLAVNSLIDELNAKPYKSELFVSIQDANPLIIGLCVNIKPSDECLSAKTSHLICKIITKQNIQFPGDSISRAVGWHLQCLKTCSDIILPDILHNLQCILQYNPLSGTQIYLMAYKCIISLLTIDDNKSNEEKSITVDTKENLVQVVINFLMKGYTKTQDEFMYCKVVISALRVLAHIHFNDANVCVQTPEIVGICRYFILYGILNQNNKPERLMPAQQTIASAPVKPNTKGGKKQKQRKQRNNAIESLKKEIPVSDRSLMKDVDNFENNAAYRPASKNYLEPNKSKAVWTLTSDSDMSDMESGREAKLIALKSRVRQSAANLFLVLFKVKEKREIFGYWWALFPDSPEPSNWLAEPNSKKTLAYCALTDPIASSRAAALSVILALLSGSRPYLSQAEVCKKWNASFIPFSVSLGNIINCMHKVLVSILDTERGHAVILVALKCCAALVQATPYHKMQEGLITELVRATRKFLIHRDVTLQVGALITIGCVLSIDPKVPEVLKSMEKDASTSCKTQSDENSDLNNLDDEEGYSDDEFFAEEVSDKKENEYCFKSWILDICFKNIGWLFKGNERVRCIPSAIPVVLESLQVLSAIAFHHLSELLKPHLTLLADVLSEVLQHEHQDVVLQASRTISIIGDAIQKLEQIDEPPNLKHCVYMWETVLGPLSSVLQHDATSAKAVVCDCIANIGERTFKELPSRTQMLCCALLVGSCGDADAAVRAAAVRALAMAVIYRTLREDMCFVCDCGENVLRALAEPSVVVRTKAAWALANLSDALVLNMQEPDIDSVDDSLLLRLLEVSIRCATDNDKVKMSAVRALGNLLRYITEAHLRQHSQLKSLCDAAVEKLLDCACRVTNMKVRWNACYALGNAMKNDVLYTWCDGWLSKAFESLCKLAQDCKNLKVRINAASALRSPWQRALYGRHLVPVWRAVMAALETAANVDDFTEYKHKDNLIEQLCVTLAHLCCLLKPSDLPEILDPLVFHFDCAKSMYAQLYNKLPPENASCLKMLQAAKFVTIDLIAETDTQQQALGMLQEIFIWDT